MKLFNFNRFNPIRPFNSTLPLSLTVQSDHAELILKTRNSKIIKMWNISNEKYAEYFNDNNGPFKETHLHVPNSKKNFVIKPGCINYLQAENIVDQFVKGEIDAHIVIEGYRTFYELLVKKLKESGVNYQLLTVPKDDKTINSSGIIINTDKFKVIQKNIMSSVYKEDTTQKEIFVPYFVLDKCVVLFAIHVNGCSSQYPKEGLTHLANIINILKINYPGHELIGMGDFNTLPDNIDKSVIKNVEGSHLLVAGYPTHVNPGSNAVNYDNVIVVSDKINDYSLVEKELLSEASRDFVACIERNRKMFLEDY